MEPKPLLGSNLTQEIVKGNVFLDRAELLWQQCLDGVKDAKEAVRTHKDRNGKVVFDGRDFAALAALLNQAHRNLELFGRGAGYLRDDPAGVEAKNMMVVLPRVGKVAPATDNLPLVDQGAGDGEKP